MPTSFKNQAVLPIVSGISRRAAFPPLFPILIESGDPGLGAVICAARMARSSGVDMKNLKLGASLALLAGACWGAMGVAAQFLFESYGFTAEGLVSLRLTAAGAAILLALSVFGRRGMIRELFAGRNLRDLLLYGAESALMQYTFFLAIARSNAGTAAVLSGAVPLFLLLWQMGLERRAPRFLEVFSLLLASAGIVLLVTKGDLTALDFSVAGVGFGLASAFFGAFCTAQPKAVLARMGAVPVTGWGLLFGGLMMTVLSPAEAFTGVWTPVSSACVLVVVLVGTVAAFVFYLASLRHITSPAASLLACTEPVTAVILTIAVLGSSIGGAEIAGAACIIGCVLLITRSEGESRSAA